MSSGLRRCHVGRSIVFAVVFTLCLLTGLAQPVAASTHATVDGQGSQTAPVGQDAPLFVQESGNETGGNETGEAASGTNNSTGNESAESDSGGIIGTITGFFGTIVGFIGGILGGILSFFVDNIIGQAIIGLTIGIFIGLKLLAIYIERYE